MKKIQNIFVETVNKIENNNAPFKRYIFLFFAILVLRLALEFFSSNRLFTFFDVMHIGLWFVFIVTAFLLQLLLYSGEDTIKVAKLVITCFTIALTAPVIDLIVSGGHSAKMNYLSINSFKDVLWAYISIGGSSLTRGATIGIRIEIVLLVIACFNYVYTKQKSIVKGLVASFSIYTVVFLSGAIPFILGMIVKKFNLHYQANDQSTLLFLLTIDVLFLFLIVAKRSIGKILFILKQAPWASFLIALTFLIHGAKMALKDYPLNWTLDPTTLFWFPLLVALCLCFMLYIGLVNTKDLNTNYFENVFYIENTLLLLILLISALLSARTFFTTALLWGILFLLYEKPLRLIKIPVLKNLLIAMAFVAINLLGFSTFGAPMVGISKHILLLMLSGVFVSSIMIEKKDAKFVVKTLLTLCFLLSVFLFMYDVSGQLHFNYWLLITALPPLIFFWLKHQYKQLFILSFFPLSALVLLTNVN
ncbi:MAG: hypothetical protein JNJ41_15985 [Bacteroidia bacterium]|nr:hypothetical protein [Bacteroidia bacterium]